MSLLFLVFNIFIMVFVLFWCVLYGCTVGDLFEDSTFVIQMLIFDT